MDLLGKVSDNKFLIHDSVLENNFNGNSCNSFSNVTLPKSPSISFSYSPNLTTFNCFNPSPTVVDYFKHYENRTCDILDIYYKLEPAEEAPVVNDDVLPGSGCTMNQMPIRSGQGFPGEVFDLFSPNFTLEWNLSEDCYECYERGGQCLTNESNRFYCRRERGNTRLKILFIGGITIASLASLLIIVFLFIRRKRAKARQDRDRDIELFLKDNGNLVPMRYKYSSIKKMTNSFTENLGRGGFGSVYKGQFPDGRLVAVKVLNDSNGNGEDFMNEVASISRTSHVNIVTLLGFCFEGSKRALIYDFMPNGSLEKFIGNNASSSQESTLGWDKLFEITLGIARGLEYLHQGCNTRILHLDIKPQNILLDKDMNPRISDFGLAKMCPNRSSIVSMLVARGTIGYIAPEVFSRNFGDVSYKSDVYSYGMLVLEMAGGKKAIDPRDVEHTSEIYFPNYLYKEVEGNAERDGNIFEAMNEGVESQPVKRNMIIVGLWCIQTNPKDRPSMTRVVEMLEGKLGSLEVPSRPYLQPSPRAAPAYSTSESL
ncbi:LEAF RUST 10 DISEASE-RESISTANCE LOCUS RECEPTOR-LIKE PROTEIN KINASE-like 2.5 [Salvia splendens]|uniref:LEAF RUST 10 DISEASE-RESISTANCE LOCUS RECEPTOR-LIKE PROTEIN KINASE-like 2.5 n=1 Tax=Salvia splendens TaxID=180675 RepID=UPI001C266773|nr:LEAF RUST 10 DISEASE-RESISTANCE LOCUS RECEPTOR-LIKE PROTEIN KINASE-like 2.5 [Salvia splendens]